MKSLMHPVGFYDPLSSQMHPCKILSKGEVVLYAMSRVRFTLARRF